MALLGATVACDPAGAATSAVDLTASERLRVDRVVDGDTVDLSDGRRVRVLGIDTPETVDPDRPVECWGPEATEFARATLLGRTVTVTGDPTQDALDAYGRTLAYLTLPDGGDYSVLAAGAGVAYAYTFDRPVQLAPRIEAAEQEARAAGRGLWGAGCPDRAGTTAATPTPTPTPTSAAVPPVAVPVVVPAQAPERVRATTTTRATPTKRPAAAAQAQDVRTEPTTTTQKKKAQASTTKKATTTTAAPKPAGGGCDPNYSGGCVPVASDVDCAGGSGNGPAYVSGPVRVVGSDVYGLDADKDGLGCE